ncbi:MAG: hypothetical protein HQ559_17495 [Lentisphaerae bacterium]|nr:hypothetical protein [Lentisphaerota bacterium]
MKFTFIFAVVTITPLAFLARNTLRRILASPQKRKRLIIFSAVLVLGVVAGYWLGFAFEYRASSMVRVFGCPLPLVVFNLEDGRWVDFIMPAPVLNGVINVIVITLLSLAPLNIIFRFPRKHG